MRYVWLPGASVIKVNFSKEPLVGLQYLKEGITEQLKASMIVDATGRNTFLGIQLRLKVTDPVFDQYVLHTWFEGYDRGDDD